MVTYTTRTKTQLGKYYVEGNALETDTLPTDVANGSKMEVLNPETQSMTIQVFDEEGSQWVPVATVSAEV